MAVSIGVNIMYHPDRRDDVEPIRQACLPLTAVPVEDPDPNGIPSPLRTAKQAWATIASGVTHHLVLQDDVALAPDFASRLQALVERFPDRPIALYTADSAAFNSFQARMAALAGQSWTNLVPWEWVPTLGLVMPSGMAADLASFLYSFDDAYIADDEAIRLFCAWHRLQLVAPIPHLLDHVAGEESLVGNTHHGARKATVPFAERAAGGTKLPTPDTAALTLDHDAMHAVCLYQSKCRVDLPLARETVFTRPFRLNADWPLWQEQCGHLGVAADVLERSGAEYLTSVAACRGDADLSALAMEAWAAGTLLGLSLERRGWVRDNADDEAYADRVGKLAIRSWIAAGFSVQDRRRIGVDGVTVLESVCAAAITRGRRFAESAWSGLQGLPVLVGVAANAGQDPLETRGPARDGALVEFVEVEHDSAVQSPRGGQVYEPPSAVGDVLRAVLLAPGYGCGTGAVGDGIDEIITELCHWTRDDELGRAQVFAWLRDVGESLLDHAGRQFVRDGVDEGFLGPGDDVAEAHAAGDIGPERHEVEKQSHRVVELRFVAACGEGPDRQVCRAGDLVRQDVEGGEQHREQGGSRRRGKSGRPGDDVGLDNVGVP